MYACFRNVIFFLFFLPENRLKHFMHTCSLEDNIHKSIFSLGILRKHVLECRMLNFSPSTLSVNKSTKFRITNTRLFKYIQNFTTKNNEIFQNKILDIFHISAQNIDCGYSLEPPRRGGSNEYPQFMF